MSTLKADEITQVRLERAARPPVVLEKPAGSG